MQGYKFVADMKMTFSVYNKNMVTFPVINKGNIFKFKTVPEH